jgi:cytidylate kinase
LKTIAIDGYSSTGKSTVAKQLAKALGFTYIDSGAMYRAITLYALQNSCFAEDKLDEEKLIKHLDDVHINFHFDQNEQKSRIYLNNTDVEQRIRGMEVSSRVSLVAAIPEVREKLVALQREMSKKQDVIMDGRDIGSVVFPEADVKFFMTATPEERARRRYEELKAKGDDTSLEDVLENLKTRDHIDSTRAHSPLIQTEDAIVVDNTNLTQEQQLELMKSYIK